MDEVQRSLKERYAHIPDLIFQRSLEKAETNGELFDILETFPKEYPVIWSEEERAWKHTTDLLQNEQYKGGTQI